MEIEELGWRGQIINKRQMVETLQGRTSTLGNKEGGGEKKNSGGVVLWVRREEEIELTPSSEVGREGGR